MAEAAVMLRAVNEASDPVASISALLQVHLQQPPRGGGLNPNRVLRSLVAKSLGLHYHDCNMCCLHVRTLVQILPQLLLLALLLPTYMLLAIRCLLPPIVWPHTRHTSRHHHTPPDVP